MVEELIFLNSIYLCHVQYLHEAKPEIQGGRTGPTVPGVNDGDPLGRKTLPDIYGLAVFRGGRMVGVVSSTQSTCKTLQTSLLSI